MPFQYSTVTAGLSSRGERLPFLFLATFNNHLGRSVRWVSYGLDVLSRAPEVYAWMWVDAGLS